MAPAAAPAPVLANVRVVLVRPKSPGNVGAVARVCANTELSGLDVVGPVGWGGSAMFDEEARRRARHASPLLDSMRMFPDLEAALADASFTVGTSTRASGSQRVASPREAAGEILEHAVLGPVVLVFGREDRGLSLDELRHCDLKVTIPSSDRYPAWNLSHAVAILAASLYEEAAGPAPGPRPFPAADLAPARHASIERLYAKLEELLLDAGYLDPRNPRRMMADLRRIIGSRGLAERDARILMGVVHQLRWACDRRAEPSPGANVALPPTDGFE